MVTIATGTADAAPAVSRPAQVASRHAQSVADEWRAGREAIITGQDGARYGTRVVAGRVTVAPVTTAPMNPRTAADNPTCTKALVVATVIFAIGSAGVLTLLAAAAIIGVPVLIIGGITITVGALAAVSAALASWSAVVSQLDKLVC
ncbi:hypothetical protein FKR81_42755 [Lentzea tibetensis]|uniref:Uncharacterized protein n=1 Tax=Lentzea tibetensis TaxID=2591470 RepID=A0A563EEI7_9PSEU|nr:hypothetical protein [Lentzea tibetensis]TWP43215.1 hypothetical protein FKR81_42755 [Lentzea tibetensis]